MVVQVMQVNSQCRSVFKYISTSFRNLFSESSPSFEISTPYNFQHVQHVEVDPQSPTGFVVSFMVKNSYTTGKLCSSLLKSSATAPVQYYIV
mmetsp:Transcript_28101/g.47283  ORF Transcript_28101/g.47283 Transcript_28101/m.47283 type:complete len:92 (+) Transcript_28101:99-374(+)